MSKSSRVLQLVHTDVMGPMKTLSKGGSRYVLNVVDDYSRDVIAFFVKNRSEIAAKLSEFKAFYKNQSEEWLKCLQSDNKKNTRNEIMHQRTVTYSPQQNGVVERMNHTIMTNAPIMLHYKGINRSTNTANSRTTPYELGSKTNPRMDHQRLFRSQGYAHVDDAKMTKHELKSFRCMFLRYA
ncbi:Rve-domain-containing hypothetical protein [Phytophthora megakarya]|uniref:Integrase catalytic domain-containing protein n=1 Tax=Phytophthora megakarya TaxID=4795 RepID=A0A225WYT0_9STRA|nr:Rve-domain-containing hypothetical protein [Phytophthora megakarya]